jgi:hypothetical protein
MAVGLAACGGSDTTTVVTSPVPAITTVTPNTGPEGGGTLVTITGANFDQGGVSVTFGGAAATNVMVVNATTITCVTPAGTGIVQLAVTTNTGIATAPFVYGGLGSPSLAAMLPTQGLETGGFPVTIAGQNFVQGGTQVAFGGNPATAVAVLDAFTLTCIAPAGVGVVQVAVTTAQGTSNPTLSFSYTPLPAVDVDVVVGSRDGDAILVFEDIVNNPAIAAARVFQAPGSPIDSGGHLDLENDTLVVANRDLGEVQVYRSFATLPDNSPPDAAVSSNGPAGIELEADDLYVAARSNGSVDIWRDVSTLASGDPADVSLTNVSPSFSCAVDVVVVNDVLYVADRCNDRVFVWNGASTLAGNPAPDATLAVGGARRLHVASNTLWVASSDSEVLLGFAPADALVDGQGPTTVVFGLVDLSERGAVTVAGTQLFYGNAFDQNGVILTRVDLAVSTVFPQAEVLEGPSGLESIYDLTVAGGLLIGSDRSADRVFWFAGATTLTDGRQPDGFLFDPRMQTTKDLVAIVN